MLTRLLRRSELEVQPALKPLPLSVVTNPRPQSTPHCPVRNLSPKRRQKRVRVCRLYPTPPSEPLIHARALLAFIQEHSPEYGGGYVPRPDLEKFYRRDLCNLKGWKPFRWTAIARQLGQITHKKLVRENRERFVGYRVPKP